MRTQRGFTLIEILLSLVILGVVTASLFMLITTTQRVSRAQSERAALQSNVRAGAIVVPTELREINAVVGAGVGPQNDILPPTVLPTGSSITFRAMRGMSTVCQAPPIGGTEIRVLGAPSWTGLRAPVPGRDAAYVFIENDPNRSIDDVWLPVLIAGVAAGNVCPGGQAGYTLTIAPAVLGLAGAVVGTPVRTYEVMEMALYAAGGNSWLGARSVSGGEAALQPILGPLTNGDGLLFEYLDAAGNPTALADQVKSVRVTLKGLSDGPIVTGTTSRTSYVRDSLVTQVVLRNALR